MACEACGGALVALPDFTQMMNEMSPDKDWHFEDHGRPSPHAARACPRCATAMTPRRLYAVEIDHCTRHGLWFDGSELARVLEVNGIAYAERQRAADRSMGVLEVLFELLGK
jgi:Zn-finger nucleic acid-binding protein